jgi:hypothetical protein
MPSAGLTFLDIPGKAKGYGDSKMGLSGLVEISFGSKFTGPQTRRRRQIYPQELTFSTTPPYGEFVPTPDVGQMSQTSS